MLLRRAHDPEIRHQRRKWVIRNLWPRRRDARDERGFPGIRKSDECHIRQKLQLQLEIERLSGLPIRLLARGLIRGRLELCVAKSTFPTPSQENALMRLCQICEHALRADFARNRPDWKMKHQIFTTPAGTKTSLTLVAILGLVLAPIPEVEQRRKLRIGLEIDNAPMAAVASIRSALRHILLPAPGNNAIAALAGFDSNFGFVEKLHEENLDFAD